MIAVSSSWLYENQTPSLSKPEQAKTIAIQRHIDNLDKRYYDELVDVIEYLNGLSLTVVKRNK